MVGAVITHAEAQVLRAHLLAHRTQLLHHAVRQVEAVLPSWDWLHMLGDVQAALMAVEEETRQ